MDIASPSYLLRPMFEIIRSVEDNFPCAVIIHPYGEISYCVDSLLDIAE
jgi:hypothetical protein